MNKLVAGSIAIAMFLLAGCGEPAEPAEFVVLGGVVIPDEGTPQEGGFALEGEDITSPGPTITVRAGEPVTITFKVADEIVPEPHDFFIVAEKDYPEVLLAKLEGPLWGAGTESLSFGAQQTITFTPDTPGSYFYICSVSDHLRRGMWGSFEVEE